MTAAASHVSEARCAANLHITHTAVVLCAQHVCLHNTCEGGCWCGWPIRAAQLVAQLIADLQSAPIALLLLRCAALRLPPLECFALLALHTAPLRPLMLIVPPCLSLPCLMQAHCQLTAVREGGTLLSGTRRQCWLWRRNMWRWVPACLPACLPAW